MTIKDWATESANRYLTMSPRNATRTNALELWRGFNRRRIIPWIGSNWWKRDWDILVILDGLRVDAAREVVDEDINSVWSPASTSIDWIDHHFSEEHRSHWENAGYVTANPFAHHDTPGIRSAKLKESDLGYLDLVYERGFQEVHGINTIPPEAVTDAAIAAWRNQDIDRLIVHYMQPHQPFRSRPDWESVFSNVGDGDLSGEVGKGGSDIWKLYRDGEITEEEIWDAYCDNLEWVLSDVRNRLLRNLDGDVTITSDHGNGMGEWSVWGHPPGAIVPSVRKVPVWRATATDEKTVKPEIEPEMEAVGSVEDNLEALGYL